MSLAQTLLKIRLQKEVFGIDSDIVDQILRVSPITPIPLASSVLRGVSVIAGKVVNILDLKILMGMEPCNENDDKARILTMKNGDDILGFLVDEVLDTITTDLKNYEENIQSKDVIDGFYKDEEHIIQLISPLEHIQKEMIDTFGAHEIDPLAKEGEEKRNSVHEDKSLKRCLFFIAGEEKFAIDLEMLRELIFVPDCITSLAESSSESIGVVTLRNELINAVDFNALMGFETSQMGHKSRFLIAQNDQRNIALCVNAVEEVKDIIASQVEQLSSSLDDGKLEALYKDDDGSIVSMIDNSYLKRLIMDYSINEKNEDMEDTASQEQSEMSEIAVFALDKEEFALDIEDVQEIIRYEDTTPIPEAPQFVEGVINLRGAVIPVVSLPERLGFQKVVTDKSKIVVCLINNEKIGFMVDDVNEILFVENEYVAENKNDSSLIKETISLENGKRVILKLRIDHLFSSNDLEEILAVNG